MKAFLCSFIILVGLPLLSQKNTTNDVDRYIQKLVSEQQCEGIAVGVASPNYTWTHSAGLADRDQKRLMEVSTPVRTASITKPLTAISILQLVEQGKIDLEATVGTYLSLFDTPKFSNVKVKHILQHSSGIRGYKNSKETGNKKNFKTFEEALSIVMGDDLLFDPGTDFQYTSYGYNVAGLLIETISGMSYDDYIKKHIFEPAGMMNSLIERQGQLPSTVAKVYHQKKPGKIKQFTDHNISDRIAGGGLLSTVEDLLKFGQAVMDHTLISEESLNLLTTNTGLKKEGNGYGMGWFLYGVSPRYGNVIGHSGGQLGCSSFIFLHPEQNIVTAVLSNTSNVEVGSIGIALRDLVPE